MRSHHLVLASLAAAAVLAGCSGPGGGDTYLLGLAAPLERSFGKNSQLGAQLAVDQINAAGGIHGDSLKLWALDDKSEDTAAIAVAERFYDNPDVLAVVGHATSGPLMDAASVYQRGLAAVGTSATSTEIAGLGEWIFRVASSDSANAAELARSAAGAGRRVAILYANDDYGQSLAEVFGQALENTGVTLVGRFPYLEDMKDFTPYIRALKARGAEVVLVAGLETGAATLIQQAHQLEWMPRFIGGDGLEPLAEMGERYNGTLVGVLYHPDMSPRARAFAEAFRAAYKREPDSSAATSYDAVQLIARALREGRASRQGIRDYLAGVGREGGSERYDGVAGPVSFDANGDPVGKPVALVRIENGRFRLQQAAQVATR
ncbi:ABC transporter substrate-binding protein [Longimicrobium sp.]|jgi:branched-chain amino acid transport system substrate-binding protein|uniref:ABC transporter substrate-binding protein n=1 Tax=Longimicrobium sp. TaxID=2029185 RepID=UPI002F9364CA